MKIKDKINQYLEERLGAPLAMAGQTNPMATNRTVNQAKQFILKNRAVLIKFLQLLNFNDNRAAVSDIKKTLGDNLFNQVMSFGWLQKTKHPGEFYELSDNGIDTIGGLAGVLR
jgi:hypothetical protein